MSAKVLVLLTSTPAYVHNGEPRSTGFYWEELAVPYWAMRDAGHSVEIASVSGGEPPADPASAKSEGRPAAVQRFLDDPAAMAALKATRSAAEIDPAAYAAIFLPGGHGTMWDFAQNAAVGSAVSAIYAKGGVVGAVCHGPAGLLEARSPDGRPLVAGKRLNGFTDAEERAAGLEGTVPFLLETELRRRGALFEGNANLWQPHAVRDGRLVTGQNPASSDGVAALMLEALEDLRRSAA